MTVSIADAIAAELGNHGVEHVFGLPGGESVELVAALERVGIQFVLARHEARAAWMADAYGRIGRRIGVCLSTLGPGAANLASGLAHCFLDRSSVLAITSQLPPSLLSRHSHQRLDLQRLFAPVTKHSHSVSATDDVAGVVQQAIVRARADRPGPVHLQLPASVLQEPAVDGASASGKGWRPRPVSQQSLREAAERLHRAARPAVVVGLGFEPSAPYEQLLKLVTSLGAPVVVTPKAKGAIPEDHPQYAGVIGLKRPEPSLQLLHHADLILALGLDPVELLLPWEIEVPTLFAAEFANQDPPLSSDVDLIGDLTVTLEFLAREAYAPTEWLPEELVATRPTWPERQDVERQGARPSQVVRAVREVLPKDGVATCDVGAHKLLIGRLWPACTPNRFLISNGLSTMGYALPAAIGAKVARPDLPVVCFIGDGGMGMVVSELETLSRMNLSVVVVVLADQAMSLIRLKQELVGYSPTGTLFAPMDWCRVAEGFGARGVVARSAGEVETAIADGLEADGPTLVEVLIDASEYQSW